MIMLHVFLTSVCVKRRVMRMDQDLRYLTVGKRGLVIMFNTSDLYN